ncbi:hypothetical protein AQUCO_03700269v1 [Aquilegia coerulea]|uniref:Uncharacterized protein n=1 Tax=Aquilegia coerulea TaxID=218851 RepID=A0A2G5CUB7_AQUCA|nr:hypothetical protein AQUCO_03700269v1 [Aquilegia coerulea]
MFTAKPSSSWLDRLRSAKGIPVNNDLDLEQFLNQNPDSNSAQLVPNQEEKTMETTDSSKDHRNEEKWFNTNTMSSVLSELFVMEDSTSQSQKIYKKSSRKQAKPKICIFSSSASVDGNNEGKAEGISAMSPASAENSVAVVKEIGDEKIDEEDKSKLDFSGYSRSDVMIIDTSSVVWKTEKLVLRKGNVWKVREKNSKSRSLSRFRKKRKFNQFDMDSGDEKKRKKKKKLKKKKQKLLLAPLSSIGNKADGDKCGGFPFKVYPENDKQIASEKTQHSLDQVPKKRQVF